VKIAIGKSVEDNKSVLALDGMEYGKWFREQKQKFLESIGIKGKPAVKCMFFIDHVFFSFVRNKKRRR
jgi:hypothetical protein